MKFLTEGRSFWCPFLILGGGFLVRLILSGFGTLSLDQGTFIAWSNILITEGPKSFYGGWSDYLPGYLYVLWFLGKVKSLIPIPDELLYKVPAIVSDILTGGLIYGILKEIKGVRWGLVGAAIYVFNPAIIANSTFWGQIDSITSFLALSSLFAALKRRHLLSGILLAIGTLIKPQAAFVFPGILAIILKDKWDIRRIFSFLASGALVFVLGFIPFWKGDDIVGFIAERITATVNQYPYTSINAFNFWGLFGFWKPDFTIPIPAGVIGVGIVSWLLGFLFLKSYKERGSFLFLSAASFITTFLFLTRMHERHLLPALAPLAILTATVPSAILAYAVLSVTYAANLFYSYKWITEDFTSVFPDYLINFFIIINVLSFLSLVVFFFVYKNKKKDLLVSLVGILKKKFSKGFVSTVRTSRDFFPKANANPRALRIFLVLIISFAFVTRVFNLGNPEKEYFDEVYHAFTARLVLNGDPKAWEWWNPHPEGFAYEWTHPPLAKLGMAASMFFLGENAFGWRFPAAFLGTGSVFLVYLIAKKLFRDDLVAVLSAFVFSLDGLTLTMSRIGMNDPYLLFFMLLAVYCFLKDRYFLSAAAFGLALSSKWSAIWAIPILFVIFLGKKKKFNLSILWFLIIPIAVYLASYIPMFATGHDFSVFWGMQKQMWWYHTGLRAEHPYTSSWWSWAFNLRPVYLYTSDEILGFVSRIYAIGNPFVFWGGLVSLFIVFNLAVLEKNRRLGFVLFSFLAFFIPWAASPRIMFLYHYLPSLPFLAIATGYVLRRFPKLITYYLLLITLAFIYFYPHWAGLNIPLWLDQSYYWLSSWR